MRLFMFLCPNTGYIVQAQADDAVPGENPHTFHLVPCASCGGSHLVDPVTGQVAVRGALRSWSQRALWTLGLPPDPWHLARPSQRASTVVNDRNVFFSWEPLQEARKPPLAVRSRLLLKEV